MINFRKILFYINDAIKGSTIKNHINDIRSIVSNPESEKSKNDRLKREKEILEYAINNVSFYRKNVGNKTEVSLLEFPVINKNIIRDNIDEFLSEGIDKSSLFRVVTSGSTGTPFSVYHDKKKKERNSADTIYFASLAGFEIGTRLNYLKIWTKVNKKSKLKAWAENIVPIDVTQLSDKNISILIDNFNKVSTKQAFLGYSSALESICRYIENSKIDNNKRISNVSSIIAMSEGLSEYAKKSIHQYFGVFPASRYSNVENGIIAQQLVDGLNTFIVNWASYFVEILKIDSNEREELGKIGRIVVTDFFNYALPMIRYDTGDIGTLDWDDKKEKIVLIKVEGRKMDSVFNTSGNLVSSFTITNNMWMYSEIKQYQFIQTGKKSYLFKLNLEGKFEREALLISEFKNYFGLDANISVEYVDEIPLLNSGKRKKVMNISK
jgi:phenylacetate-CoA ligase